MHKPEQLLAKYLSGILPVGCCNFSKLVFVNFILFMFPLHYCFNESRSIFEIPGHPGFQDRSQDRFIRHRRGTSTHTRGAAKRLRANVEIRFTWISLINKHS